MTRHDQHQHPLTYIGRHGRGRHRKRWYRCERCGAEFSEQSPTEYAGCCDESRKTGGSR